jgi:hypothetical protein
VALFTLQQLLSTLHNHTYSLWIDFKTQEEEAVPGFETVLGDALRSANMLQRTWVEVNSSRSTSLKPLLRSAGVHVMEFPEKLSSLQNVDAQANTISNYKMWSGLTLLAPLPIFLFTARNPCDIANAHFAHAVLLSSTDYFDGKACSDGGANLMVWLSLWVASIISAIGCTFLCSACKAGRKVPPE